VLDQVATLHDDNLYPHRLVRLDDAVEQPAELIDALNVALDLELAPPPPSRAPAIRRLPAGRWRDYTGPLGAAFDALSDVARRLGYAAG